MSKRTAAEELPPSVTKERKLSSSNEMTTTATTLPFDLVHQILLFVNFFDNGTIDKSSHNAEDEKDDEEKEDKHDDELDDEEKDDEKENDEENEGDETEAKEEYNLLDLMLINSQWNQVLHSDEYYKNVLVNFLKNQAPKLHYFKVLGYEAKKLEDYEVLISKGLYQSWKEVFANLFYRKFLEFNEDYNNAYSILAEEQATIDEEEKNDEDKDEDEEDEKPENFIKILEKEATLCINVFEESFDETDSLPIGSSKFGGRPDLPNECAWPIMKNDPTTHMIFVAQINLRDLKHCHAPKGVLPCTGWLFFFMDWGVDGDYFSFYWNGAESELQRRDMPDKVYNDTKSLKSASLRFEEVVQPVKKSSIEELNLPDDSSFTPDGSATILGYPMAFQDDEKYLHTANSIFLFQYGSNKMQIDMGDANFYYCGKIEEFCGEKTKSKVGIYSEFQS